MLLFVTATLQAQDLPANIEQQLENLSDEIKKISRRHLPLGGCNNPFIFILAAFIFKKLFLSYFLLTAYT